MTPLPRLDRRQDGDSLPICKELSAYVAMLLVKSAVATKAVDGFLIFLTGFIRKTMAVGLWESNYRLRFRSARRELDLTETVERGLVSKSESVSALPPDFSSGSNCQTQSDSLHSQASTVA